MNGDQFPRPVGPIEAARTLWARSPGVIAAVPLVRTTLADQVTPALVYRRLVRPDQRTDPSFLFESVEQGQRVGRFSMLSSRPIAEAIARSRDLTILDANGIFADTVRAATASTAAGPQRTVRVANPIAHIRQLVEPFSLCSPWSVQADGSLTQHALHLPFLGGLVGFAGYDTVRYTEPQRLCAPPPDDRGLPDLHFGFYDSVVVFDHVAMLVHVVQLALLRQGDDHTRAIHDALRRLERTVHAVHSPGPQLAAGSMPMARSSMTGHGAAEPTPLASNITRDQHRAMVERALEYIRAGDIFQVVLGQRFERHSRADPFDVYRVLRAVNPSPYMVYLQARGCILVASSPEILCRVRPSSGAGSTPMVVTNRPLAGTRRRGKDTDEDRALERQLLADPKERAEHAMLVDLGRNDVGRVAQPGTIQLPAVMEIERYSHVMHISSTVTGELRPGMHAFDALAAALPVGTISGAPKIRAMQIIDELEPVRRGPYGGGMGYIGLDGCMDIALALRTIVVPTAMRTADRWLYHLQAAGGIVLHSQPDAEFDETVNKAAALAHAIDLAELALAEQTGRFAPDGEPTPTERSP